MAWKLTAPYLGGDLDPKGVYDQVKITEMRWRDSRKFISLSLAYGTTVDGVWTPGMTPAGKSRSVLITKDTYDALVSHKSKDGESSYAAVKRGLYEWLSANGHVDAGSII